MTGRPDFTDRYIDLAQPRLGAGVISASDDFFAPKERLIKPEAPIFIPDKFDDHGKWMDGWESRRKREDGHDFCVIRLCPGTIHGVDIDTVSSPAIILRKLRWKPVTVTATRTGKPGGLNCCPLVRCKAMPIIT